ncbi:MAG: hypothetical protein HY852_20360 [Bradyrhizobium sp.]|uniref:hypothetical protein n=1 Tax=Bradyrhizobium sp. TaxID=376 RepID=UPI0025BF54BD|nr:hypothetical protein [Bradyrhizobium sp.]MBI5264162.1 hypothetical protein [Bradyrhizobium sp.]
MNWSGGSDYAVYLPDLRPPAKVRVFIDFLAVRFSPEPPWDRGLAHALLEKD